MTQITAFFEKRLGPRERAEPEAIARLRSEAMLLGHLNGGGGVTPRLLESGDDEHGPWLRIERIDLLTFARRKMMFNHSLDWIDRAAIAAMTALMKIHEAVDANGVALDIVHADLSPANIAIDDTGERVVILDFDLAWWRDAPRRDDGAFRGTIGYVAPEIARGERPSVRSDLFSLAATLLQLGRETASDAADISFAALLARAAETPVLDSRGNAALRQLLGVERLGQQMLLSCLAHDPADRPASARAALGRCARSPASP